MMRSCPTLRPCRTRWEALAAAAAGALSLCAAAQAGESGACCFPDGACLLLEQAPCEGPVLCRGDANCDGVVNFGDIDPFVLALQGQAAYQLQYPNCDWLNSDTNGDGTVDFADIDPFVALIGASCAAPGLGGFWAGAGVPCDAGRCIRDCNNNGVHDPNDIAGGASLDCNLDQVPDECQDCDDDGVGDVCAIAAGAAPDVNGNWIPDACEVDCNNNAVPDVLDIELAPAIDCNENAVIDACEIDLGAADCNADGVPDECQVIIDCNANGVPDACDPDCNNNGKPDDCDVLFGGIPDVDADLTPDECQPDCNGNAVPDSFEIAQGAAADCNQNGNPDACDLQTGASLDQDGTMIPDECEPRCPAPPCDLWRMIDGDADGVVPTMVNLANAPIPADFFGPGSEPFFGTVLVVGLRPLDVEQWGVTDTVVRRLNNPFQPNQPPGGQALVPVEMVALSLVSAQPITVTYGASGPVEHWHVYVSLSEGPQPPGQMQAFKTHPNGGNLQMNLPILPRLVFRLESDPSVFRVLDYAQTGQPPWITNWNAPWVHQARPEVDARSGPGSNMVAGVIENPPGGPQQIVPVQAGGPVLGPGPQCPNKCTLDIKIFDGLAGACAPACGGALIPDGVEVSRGAATVANINDTNGDLTIDRDQMPVTASDARGRDELDLMKLIIEKPRPDMGGAVTVTIVEGDAAFWTDSVKGGPVPNPAVIPTAALPQTIWVEARGVSTVSRDIKIVAVYKFAFPGDPNIMITCADEVRATGVWATHSLVRNLGTGSQEFPAGLDDTGLRSFIDRTIAAGGSRYGIADFNHPSGDGPITGGRILHEHTVMPADPRPSQVAWDSSRVVHARDYLIASGSGALTLWTPDFKKEFPHNQTPLLNYASPNDDRVNNDEDSTPFTDRIYSWDTPAHSATPRGVAFWVRRDAFREFVRVRLSPNKPFRNGNFQLQGSRASEWKDWRYVHYQSRGVDGRLVSDTASVSASSPLRTGSGNGTALVAVKSGAGTEGFTATFTNSSRSWTLTGTSGASVSTAAASATPGTVWVLDLPDRVRLTITSGSSGFNNSSKFTFSTFKTALPSGKTSVIELGTLDPTLGP